MEDIVYLHPSLMLDDLSQCPNIKHYSKGCLRKAITVKLYTNGSKPNIVDYGFNNFIMVK